MKKLVSVILLSLTALVVPVHQADAAESCVTKAEFKKVKHGMTKKKVHQIFDSRGKQTFVVSGYESRDYKPCTDPRYGFVTVDFDHGNVDSKAAYWG